LIQYLYDFGFFGLSIFSKIVLKKCIVESFCLKLHDEISNVADSLLDLRKRLRDEELKTEDHGMHLREHEETLDNHGNDLADLKNLRSELDNMSNLYESKFKEMAETRAALGDGVGRGNSEISNETVEKLQARLKVPLPQ